MRWGCPMIRQLFHSKSTFKLEQLTERSLIRLSGQDAASYLQGLITNDVQHLNGSSSLYAMFLNQKGRVLYDTIIYNAPREATFFIEADKRVITELKNHLLLYKVRRKISADIIDDEYRIWVTTSQETLNLTDSIECHDPRVAELGSRLIIPNGCNVAEELQRKGINLNKETFYKKLRYELGVGEGVEELPPGNCFPLESNCDYLHGVSFHKGCYIGQELTARTHHTGAVRKRLMPVYFQEEIVQLPENTNVISKSSDKNCGKIRGVTGKLALGLLRVEEALRIDDLEVEGKSLKTKRPNWWPIEAPKKRLQNV